ncbi:hypothetical protein ACFY93_30510 [Streptomyces sp. NPDC008313]|uniref:hypothetical protein n=1 Tax=Streptomyces sp. NPDC008313 TaxID=3364826 RepID=UPI0036E692A5
MSTPPASPLIIEVSGAEALWLLEAGAMRRLVCPRRDLTVVRPGRLPRPRSRTVSGFRPARAEA